MITIKDKSGRINKARKECEKLKKSLRRKKFSNSYLVDNKIDEILGELNKNKGILTYEKLKKIPLNTCYKINEYISVIKKSEGQNHITFQANLKPEGSFSVHAHNCFELVKVVKGSLIETKRRDKIYKEGDIIAYSKMEWHSPKATEESEYEVSFIK